MRLLCHNVNTHESLDFDHLRGTPIQYTEAPYPVAEVTSNEFASKDTVRKKTANLLN